MPCTTHAIFYHGCGTIILACSDPEAPNSHTPPTEFPCNVHIPHTINISLSSCPDCNVQPEGFQHVLTVEHEYDGFDEIFQEWTENVTESELLEEYIQTAVSEGLKRKAVDMEPPVKSVIEAKIGGKLERVILIKGASRKIRKISMDEDEVDWEQTPVRLEVGHPNRRKN